ncbi:GAP family protein [Lysinibacillus sp. 3P01SB]|uniref:GAP family protein n=1 Tax=Lysinibacillus sp. 3P01SB TaxID=3132284 RepID=UPI0039A4BF2F
MSTLLYIIAGLAFVDMLLPATLGITLYLLLTMKKKVTRHLFVYLFTVSSLYFGVGVLLMLGLGYILRFLSDIFQDNLISWGLLLIGATLFITGFYLPRKGKKKNKRPMPTLNNMYSMVAIGFTTALVEVSTAFPYFAAIGLMTSAKLTWIEWLPILIAYNALMLVPSILVFLFFRFFSNGKYKRFEKWRSKVENNRDTSLSWFVSMFGLLLIFVCLDYL